MLLIFYVQSGLVKAFGPLLSVNRAVRLSLCLLNPNLIFYNGKKDTSGRVVSLLARAGEINYNIVNVYAPTNPSERKPFFESLRDYFFPNSVKILVGDLNCIKSEKDKFGGNFISAKELTELRKNLRLTDIWQKSHGSIVQCTWFNSPKSIGSRLDKFLIAHKVIPTVIRCEILACYFSDHDSVDLVFDVKCVSSHGPGLWWLNIELLHDTEFCNLISRMISKHVEFQCCFPSVHEWWDFLKISFRDIAQAFGKCKQT